MGGAVAGPPVYKPLPAPPHFPTKPSKMNGTRKHLLTYVGELQTRAAQNGRTLPPSIDALALDKSMVAIQAIL